MRLPWKIYAIRVFLILYFVGDVVLLSLALFGSAVGQSAILIALFESEGAIPDDTVVSGFGLALLAILLLCYLAALVWSFRSLDRLLTTAYRGDLASRLAARTMRSLGRALAFLSLVLVFATTFGSTLAFGEAGEVVISPFEIEVIIGLIGLALWLYASLAEDAAAMKEELKGVV